MLQEIRRQLFGILSISAIISIVLSISANNILGTSVMGGGVTPLSINPKTRQNCPSGVFLVTNFNFIPQTGGQKQVYRAPEEASNVWVSDTRTGEMIQKSTGAKLCSQLPTPNLNALSGKLWSDKLICRCCRPTNLSKYSFDKWDGSHPAHKLTL